MAWQVFFFSALGLLATEFLVPEFLASLLNTSSTAMAAFRCLLAVVILWLLTWLAVIAFVHYRYLLSTGIDLRFGNIGLFFAMWVVLFGMLYWQLYTINPSLFSWKHPAYVPSKTATAIPISLRYLAYFEFLIYSACTAVSTSVPELTAASIFVSALNVLEVVGIILLLALAVATFVNISSKSKDLK